MNQMTLEGQEPLQMVPSIEGCLVVVKLKEPSKEPFLELDEHVIRAYLALNEGRVQNHIAVVDVDNLDSAFQLAQELFEKGIVINEIRNFKSFSSSGYLMVSHSDLAFLKQAIKTKARVFLDSKNIELMRFLGLSNITING